MQLIKNDKHDVRNDLLFIENFLNLKTKAKRSLGHKKDLWYFHLIVYFPDKRFLSCFLSFLHIYIICLYLFSWNVKWQSKRDFPSTKSLPKWPHKNEIWTRTKIGTGNSFSHLPHGWQVTKHLSHHLVASFLAYCKAEQ